MANEKNAIVNQSPKVLDYQAKETEIKNGERKQEAIVNQEPKKNIVNTILVNEFKQAESDDVNFYVFNEGEILTDEIFNTLKNGDIILIRDKSFVIRKQYNVPGTSRAIIGDCFTSFAGTRFDVYILYWNDSTSLTISSTSFSQKKKYKHQITCKYEVEEPVPGVPYHITIVIINENSSKISSLGNLNQALTNFNPSAFLSDGKTKIENVTYSGPPNNPTSVTIYYYDFAQNEYVTKVLTEWISDNVIDYIE